MCKDQNPTFKSTNRLDRWQKTAITKFLTAPMFTVTEGSRKNKPVSLSRPTIYRKAAFFYASAQSCQKREVAKGLHSLSERPGQDQAYLCLTTGLLSVHCEGRERTRVLWKVLRLRQMKTEEHDNCRHKGSSWPCCSLVHFNYWLYWLVNMKALTN